MSLVVSIVFGTILMGLFVRRWRPLHGILLGIWVCLMVALYYAKNR